jgi:hypothetical protein
LKVRQRGFQEFASGDGDAADAVALDEVMKEFGPVIVVTEKP